MEESATAGEQLSLLRSRVRSRRVRRPPGPAPDLPVARVVVELSLAHLDRPFDYLVPEPMHADAVPGCRVKVRFAGRDVGGFLVERRAESGHTGRLAPLRRVVSPEPVLTPAVHAVSRLAADRYAGSLADMLRLAVPPRHARAEAETSPHLGAVTGVPTGAAELAAPWHNVSGGDGLLARLASGQSPHAVWTAPPGADWASCLASAAAAALSAGRGAVVCLPDLREVRAVAGALERVVGPEAFVALTSEAGPAARYRAFLAVSRGLVRIVVGTRSAALAPVHDLGLVAIWDDGDDLHAEPRAPYPHTRELLLLRAHHEHAGMLLGGFSRSVEAQALVESRWAVALEAPRTAVRDAAARVHVTGESDHELARDPVGAASRMPRQVFSTVREALTTGPVLVHAPRYGYQPALVCDGCRLAARCRHCAGPLARAASGDPPACRWCGRATSRWVCPHCLARGLRAPVAGALRTAEEWGRSFPQTSVVASGGDHVLDEVGGAPAIVVATPGAEPAAEGGYAAAVLLDTWLTLGRSSLDAAAEALRRWLNIVSLVRPAHDGGRVVAVGDPSLPVLQALVRLDPVGFAARELGERTEARLPPAYRLATLTGPAAAIIEALAALDLPRQTDVLGPVPAATEGTERVVLRIERHRGAALTRALQQLQAGRSSRKQVAVRVQVDPVDFR